MYQGKELNKVTILFAVLAIFGGVVGGAVMERIMTNINYEAVYHE